MRLNDVKYGNFILKDSVEAVYRKVKITIIFNRHTGKFTAVYCGTRISSQFLTELLKNVREDIKEDLRKC